ncbi:TNKS2 [Symbiodinium sp. CCMP2592]|nr:TNKS2 [Symbiodinium sp. CCMP2592]
MGDEMDVADDGPEEIPVATQHAFLDQAKSYNFVAVKDMVTAQPGLVNVQPAGRWSALHQAAEAGEEAVVKFLLDHGADKNVKTKDGRTPLQVCKNAACRALLGGPEKRSAGYKPEGEPVAKAPAAKDLTITVNYAASGELLKTATVCTGDN